VVIAVPEVWMGHMRQDYRRVEAGQFPEEPPYLVVNQAFAHRPTGTGKVAKEFSSRLGSAGHRTVIPIR